MSSLKFLAPLFALGLFSTTVLADEAHICRSASLPQSNSAAVLSDNTQFSCGSDISGTVPALSKLGWKVTHVLEQSDMSALSSMKTGKMPPNPEDLAKTYWVLIIQK
nr:hypothetical protein [uncultured Pantoea sp.]